MTTTSNAKSPSSLVAAAAREVMFAAVRSAGPTSDIESLVETAAAELLRHAVQRRRDVDSVTSGVVAGAVDGAAERGFDRRQAAIAARRGAARTLHGEGRR